MAENQGEPKIVIDSDWKAQAQAERAKLAEQEKKAAASKPSGGAEAGDRGQYEGLPPADFETLMRTLITQALIYMGGFPDPETGRAMVSLEHAKFHIDLIGVLEEKTKGNLSEEEAADMAQALNELRMRFVEISKAVAAAVQRGAMQGGPGGVMGAGGAGPRVGPATGPSLGL